MHSLRAAAVPNFAGNFGPAPAAARSGHPMTRRDSVQGSGSMIIVIIPEDLRNPTDCQTVGYHECHLGYSLAG